MVEQVVQHGATRERHTGDSMDALGRYWCSSRNDIEIGLTTMGSKMEGLDYLRTGI